METEGEKKKTFCRFNSTQSKHINVWALTSAAAVVSQLILGSWDVYLIAKHPPFQTKIYLTLTEMFTNKVMFYSRNV